MSADGSPRTHAAFRLVLTLVLALNGLGAALPAAAESEDRNNSGFERGKGLAWVPTWATASKVRSPFDPPTPALNDVTLRQVVRISVGGRAPRVWLTNEFGTEPLLVGAAHVARTRKDIA